MYITIAEKLLYFHKSKVKLSKVYNHISRYFSKGHNIKNKIFGKILNMREMLSFYGLV